MIDPKILLFVFLLLLKDHSLLVSCQKDFVYRGTGVDYKGSHNSNTFNNQTVILGGLFAIHKNENNECARVLTRVFQIPEAMALAIDRINNDTSFLPGVTLAYEIRDTCILPNYALEQSLSLITVSEPLEDGTSVGVSGVVGTSSSSVSIPVASLLRLFMLPQIRLQRQPKCLVTKLGLTTFFVQLHLIHFKQEPLLQLSSSSTGLT